ncbi:MAG: alpha/beta hydrolase-fold protein [Planctomycetia bacterium]|nr:alpha/beta hydrolase-fold protein [Planctomycetia bacterium]
MQDDFAFILFRTVQKSKGFLSFICFFALFIGFLSFLCNSVSAAETRVVLKDGRVEVGAIYPVKSVIELPNVKPEKERGVQSQKILIIDDNLRTIYVPKNNILDLSPDEVSASLEVFRIHQRVNRVPSEQVAALGAWRTSVPFDEFGRRTIMAGGTPVVQGITEIAPHYIRAEGLNFYLDMRLSPYSIPRTTLSKLIKKQINPKSLDDRLRIYQFYVQAELYEQAQEELTEIIEDFKEEEGTDSQLEVGLTLIRQLAASRLIDELELRQRAGQYYKVHDLLKSFQETGVSTDKVQAIRRMLLQYEEDARRETELLDQLTALHKAIGNEELRLELTPLLTEINRELNHNTIGRFSEYFLAMHDGAVTDEQRLALALSGWLAGSTGADNRLEFAASLYRTRKLIRRFLLEKLPDARATLFESIRGEEAASPERVSLLLRAMKPPQSTPASARETPLYYQITVPSFDGTQITYYVQLPPEYDPNRKYPTVVTLHGERTTAPMQVDWWCGPWSETTDRKGDPVRERYGQATRNGYIVIAPVWAQRGQKYKATARALAAVLYSLRDANRRFAIDTDRVFLSGHSAGGDATWDIALAHPDLWAGIIPICGAATKFAAELKRNAASLAVYAVGGELDGGKLAASREVLDWGMDLSKPYDMTYVQYRGRGSEAFSDELMKIFEWMALRTRNFFPKEERTVYSLRPWDNFFWCVELTGFPQKYMVDPAFWTRGKVPVDRAAKTEFFKVNANSIKIKSNADRAWIFLTPEYLDFQQKIEVLFNSKKISPSNGMITPSLRTLLEDARTRCDRIHPFHAVLDSARPGIVNPDDSQ